VAIYLSGGRFFIRLTAKGSQSFQDVRLDNAQVMSRVYEILFRLENRLRQFIESKLRSKYGPDRWDKYVQQDMSDRSLPKSISNIWRAGFTVITDLFAIYHSGKR
jgi:hypothetical protein